MLKIDMPMPKGCTWIDENGNGHLCPLLDIDCDCVLQEKGRKIGWAEQYAKCPIKGELVQCGECANETCSKIHKDMPNWFCAEGERKEQTNATD